MNRQIAIITLTSILLAPNAWSGQHTATVHSVKDGDTIVVTINGRQEQLQLLGIDAPEDVPNPKLQKDMERTKLGLEPLIAIGRLATVHLSTLTIPGQPVEVDATLTKRDHYGRIPAIVKSASGRNVNAAMIADGYATVLGRYPFDTDLKAKLLLLQQKAITEKLGLWGIHPDTTKAWGGR